MGRGIMEQGGRNKKTLRIQGMNIGNGAPVRVESMLKSPLNEEAEAFEEMDKLEAVGCELVRVAFPSSDLAPDLSKLLKRTNIPIMADVHFDFALAIEAIRCGSKSVRINPGNMEDKKGLRELVHMASKEGVVLRIGANSGSLPERHLKRCEGDSGAALAEAVADQVKVMEQEGFTDIILSAKSTSLQDTVRSNLMLAERFSYPLHVGITEAGPGRWGIVKSSCGLTQILSQGVGDTLRVSLTGPSTEEVLVGQAVLQHLGVRRFRADLVSCPTCGRKRVDVERLVRLVEPHMDRFPKNWTVAVMGCEVNGPREAAHADFGIAGTASGVAVFRYGRIVERWDADQAEERLSSFIESWLDNKILPPRAGYEDGPKGRSEG
jgi:(E)-4-hydroxy-3-methylbut-2-enyl-diphosphate synthase